MTDTQFKDANLTKSQNGIITFSEMPDFELYLKAYNIPPVSVNPILIPTSEHDYSIPNNKATYDPMTVTFLVDENLEAHSKMIDWMLKCKLFEKNHAIDATLFVLSNKGNVIREVKFIGLWPFQIGEVQYDLNADDEIISTATFSLTCYEYGKIYGT